MKKARRIAVVILAFLICIALQEGFGVLCSVALVIDAAVIITLAVIELKRK